MSNGSEPVFPQETKTITLNGEMITLLGSSGLTKREYFAAAALQGILANGRASLRSIESIVIDSARVAVAQADALLRELSSNKESGE